MLGVELLRHVSLLVHGGPYKEQTTKSKQEEEEGKKKRKRKRSTNARERKMKIDSEIRVLHALSIPSLSLSLLAV